MNIFPKFYDVAKQKQANLTADFLAFPRVNFLKVRKCWDAKALFYILILEKNLSE